MLTKQFILAGKAIFTVSNGREGAAAADYTYKVTKKENKDDRTRTGDVQPSFRDDVYFVALLTGPNNEADYTYLGLLDPATGRVRLTAKSKFDAGSTPVKAVSWALGHVWAGRELPGNAKIQHVGKCGKCARALTVPESIETGLGPECSGLGYTKPRNEARKPRTRKPKPLTFEEQRAAAAQAQADRLAEAVAEMAAATPLPSLQALRDESLQAELEAERRQVLDDIIAATEAA